MARRSESAQNIEVRHFNTDGGDTRQDWVAAEEPMEIRIVAGPADSRFMRSLSVTMRTPGADFDLAVGFLFTEGILKSPGDIDTVEYRGAPAPGQPNSNIVRVELTPQVTLDIRRLQRHFYTTSSCGVCGKASIDAVEVQGIKPLDVSRPRIESSLVQRLPAELRKWQPAFAQTGGLHAAALVDAGGAILDVCEDVGRHNAVDKLVGRQFLAGNLPLADHILLVSGRASFEIVQKALVAGLPVMVAVGAPSSLAVELASRFDMTLIGFAAADRFNLYCGAQRLVNDSQPARAANPNNHQLRDKC